MLFSTHYFLFRCPARKQINLIVFRHGNKRRIIRPWRKHGNSRLTPQTFNDCPCDLFIDIANASHTGNRNRFNVKWHGMRTIKTTYPLYFSIRIVASEKLYSLDSSQQFEYITKTWLVDVFRNIIINSPTFNCRTRGGNPRNSSEFTRSWSKNDIDLHLTKIRWDIVTHRVIVRFRTHGASWWFGRCRTISRLCKFSLTTTMATTSIVSALKHLACCPAGVKSAQITIVWSSDGMWSSAVLNNATNSICWWKKVCSCSTIGLFAELFDGWFYFKFVKAN